MRHLHFVSEARAEGLSAESVARGVKGLPPNLHAAPTTGEKLSYGGASSFSAGIGAAASAAMHAGRGSVRSTFARAPPPSTYVCRICNVPGHWIENCPEKNKPRQHSVCDHATLVLHVTYESVTMSVCPRMYPVLDTFAMLVTSQATGFSIVRTSKPQGYVGHCCTLVQACR